MPQPTQHSLIHVLLLWITVLSIVQAVFIILFFTNGHRGPSQNSSAEAPQHTAQSQANATPLPPPSSQGVRFGKGKMFTYDAKEVSGDFKWIAKDPRNDLVSEKGKDLQIKQDGFYFLNLQVTLNTGETDKCPCNRTRGLDCMVLLRWSLSGETLLQGRINKNTCSTGLLGRVKELSGGGTLMFTINMPRDKINETSSLTYLDIIFIPKS